MSNLKDELDAKRVEFLRSLMVLDTAPDKNLDRIVNLASVAFNVPVAVISLIDENRQWIKSVKGMSIDETPRENSICNKTIESDDLFEAPDTTQHPLLRDNPFVTKSPYVRYYIGAPIKVSGYRIGALCLLDFKPREAMTQVQRETLQALADIAAREIYMQHLLREALPLVVGAAVGTTSTVTGTGIVVSEGSGTTTTTGTGTTVTTGTGTTTTTTTGTGTTTTTGTGTTTTTGSGTTTTTGTGTTTRTGEGTTTSETEGLDVVTTENVVPQKGKKNNGDKKNGNKKAKYN